MPALAGDGVKNLSRRLGLRIDPLDTCIQNLQRRHDEVGRVQHVEQGATGAGKALLHNERQFRFHPRGDEAVGWHRPTIGKEHVVEQHAGIRLVDIERALHRLRGQADLVALHHAPLGELDLDPGLLNRIGVIDGDVGKFQRELSDLRARLLRPMQAFGSDANFFFREGHAKVDKKRERAAR
jgi:hypothetical protein